MYLYIQINIYIIYIYVFIWFYDRICIWMYMIQISEKSLLDSALRSSRFPGVGLSTWTKYRFGRHWGLFEVYTVSNKLKMMFFNLWWTPAKNSECFFHHVTGYFNTQTLQFSSQGLRFIGLGVVDSARHVRQSQKLWWDALQIALTPLSNIKDFKQCFFWRIPHRLNHVGW